MLSHLLPQLLWLSLLYFLHKEVVHDFNKIKKLNDPPPEKAGRFLEQILDIDKLLSNI